MIEELLEMAFKCYAYEAWMFDSSITYKIDEFWNWLTLFCMMDNEPELDDLLRSKWWIRYNITWFNRVLQIQQGFLYEVQVDYYKWDLKEKIDHQNMIGNNIKLWHKWFLSKVLQLND